jgi:hypothetical protein
MINRNRETHGNTYRTKCTTCRDVFDNPEYNAFEAVPVRSQESNSLLDLEHLNFQQFTVRSSVS